MRLYSSGWGSSREGILFKGAALLVVRSLYGLSSGGRDLFKRQTLLQRNAVRSLRKFFCVSLQWLGQTLLLMHIILLRYGSV